MFTKERAKFGSGRWFAGIAFKAILTSSVMFVISGGYRDLLARQASRVSVEVAAPVPVRDLVESLTSEDLQQIRCMSEAMYYEAGNQGETGMMAVGDVVYNRLASGRYPGSICQIIDEGPRDTNGRLLHNRCQFTYRCDGTDLTARNEQRWALSYRTAYTQYVYRSKIVDITGGAQRYYASYIPKPKWDGYIETIQIGVHKFYKPKDAKS